MLYVNYISIAFLLFFFKWRSQSSLESNPSLKSFPWFSVRLRAQFPGCLRLTKLLMTHWVFPSPVETLHTGWTKRSFQKNPRVSVSACCILAGHPVTERELCGDGQQMAGRKGTGRKRAGPIRLLLLQPREFSRQNAHYSLESSSS